MSKILILLFLFTQILFADEIRPAYLEIKQKDIKSFAMLFKVPAKKDERLSIYVQLPTSCSYLNSSSSSFIKGAYVEHSFFRCKDNIQNKSLTIKGLEKTNTQLLLRIEFLNKTSQSVILKPTKSTYTIKEDASSTQIIKTYSVLGIEHILMGYDHLLFIFALLLIVRNFSRLLWTISAFTLAHSITMASATLGFVHVSQAPVEAVIALSILFLAIELIYKKESKTSLTFKYPWLIAFIFGLLHGFGFAGALAEIGLPQHAITLALIFFNIGVEIGQLIFVVSVVMFSLIFAQYKNILISLQAKKIMIYIIGSLSSFWLIERLLTFA